MRLLFDHNISFKLIARLSDMYPNSQHVREIGLMEADDRDIWEYAGNQGLIIVCKSPGEVQHAASLRTRSKNEFGMINRFDRFSPIVGLGD